MDNQYPYQSEYQQPSPPPPPPPPVPTFDQPLPTQQPQHHGHHEHGHHHGDHHQSHQAPNNLFSPPPPPPAETASLADDALRPQPVVHVLSPRGVEYAFLTITLFTGAIGLITALLSLVNGQTSFKVLGFPVSLLLVSVPVFSWVFLRLKQAELANPGLRLDASKRRSTQFIQIVSFLVCFFALIGLVTTVLAKMSGDFDGSVWKAFLDVLVLEVVAGGILYYYWRDERKL